MTISWDRIILEKQFKEYNIRHILHLTVNLTSRPKVRKAPLKNLSMRNIWPGIG